MLVDGNIPKELERRKSDNSGDGRRKEKGHSCSGKEDCVVNPQSIENNYNRPRKELKFTSPYTEEKKRVQQKAGK